MPLTFGVVGNHDCDVNIMVLNNECTTAYDPSVEERHAWATMYTGLSSSGT